MERQYVGRRVLPRQPCGVCHGRWQNSVWNSYTLGTSISWLRAKASSCARSRSIVAITFERVSFLSCFFRCSIYASVSRSIQAPAKTVFRLVECLRVGGVGACPVGLSAVLPAVEGWPEAALTRGTPFLSCHNGAGVSDKKRVWGFWVFIETHHLLFVLNFVLRMSKRHVR